NTTRASADTISAPPRRRASASPSAVLPVAVGPTTATAGGATPSRIDGARVRSGRSRATAAGDARTSARRPGPASSQGRDGDPGAVAGPGADGAQLPGEVVGGGARDLDVDEGARRQAGGPAVVAGRRP